MNNTKENNNGFTLAEVLITLLIIGVVAGLVVPNLINDSQNAEFKAAWKKSYSEIDQATRLIMLDNGGTLLGTFPDYRTSFKSEYVKYLSYTKNCNASYSNGNCWHKNWEYYFLNGTKIAWEDVSGIILSNGSLLRFDGRSGESENCITTKNSNAFQGICGWINVDVNGFKGPNTLGKDIFDVYILKDRILPFGVPNDGELCSGTGRGCSAQYLYQ